VPGTDYTASTKTSIVLTQAASLNDTLEVIAYDVATMDDSISATDGGTFNSDVTFAAGADILTASAGTDNVRLGEDAGASIASGGNQNTLIGKDAGKALTTGDANVIVGHSAGDALTDADYNVAVGFGALSSDTKGDRSVAIGLNALQAQNHTSVTQTYNTAVGDNAGYASTTGINNTFIGALSGDAVTTGNLNTFVGSNAGSATDDGASNTAVGAYALDAGNCADHNTAIGAGALGGSSFTGYDNTCVGSDAGNASTTGYSNTFVGKTAGSTVTTGNANTIIGRYDGNEDGLDIRTSSNNIILADGAGNYHFFVNASGEKVMRGGGVPASNVDSGASSGSYFGDAGDYFTSRATTSTSIHIRFMNSNGLVGNISTSGAATSFNTSSDYRLKENVTYDWDATSRLKQLKPARFNFISDNTNTLVDGFIAHEVSNIVPEAITGEKDGVKVWNEADNLPKDEDGKPTVSVGDNKLDADGNTIPEYQGIDQAKLVPLLVKTIQELEARITVLEGE
jgi:hypothetical protein